jgi:hypothetical protein
MVGRLGCVPYSTQQGPLSINAKALSFREPSGTNAEPLCHGSAWNGAQECALGGLRLSG